MATETKRKTAIDQRAGGHGWIWPEANPPIDGDACTQGCVLVGLDTDDGPSHKYYDRRVKEPIQEALVRAMMVARPQDIPAISVARIPGIYAQFYVIIGRKRVLTMREVNRRLIATGEPPRKLLMHVDTSNNDASVHTAIAHENLCRKEPTPLVRSGAKFEKHPKENGQKQSSVAKYATSMPGSSRPRRGRL